MKISYRLHSRGVLIVNLLSKADWELILAALRMRDFVSLLR